MLSCLLAFILMTFVFLALIFRPTHATFLANLDVFFSSETKMLEISAMSSANIRSSRAVLKSYRIPFRYSSTVLSITQLSTMMKINPDIIHPCSTPVVTLNKSEMPPS